MDGYHCIWGGHWLLGILFIALIIWLIARSSQYYGSYNRWGRHPMWGPPSDLSSNKALDILKERYARGEINKEEFEEKKKDLMQ